MAKVFIGKKTYEIPPLNFAALERAWPFINDAMTNPDPIRGVSASIHVIAAGLIEADNFDLKDYVVSGGKTISSTENLEDQQFLVVARFLKKATLAAQIPNIRQAVVEITVEAGLEANEGEPEKEKEMPLTETSTPSSLSSLPQDVKAEAGLG